MRFLQWVEEVGDSAIIRCVQNRRVDEPLRLAHAAVRAQRYWATSRSPCRGRTGARPASDGGDAGVDHDAAARSRKNTPRLAADVDAGGGVGAECSAGRRGAALVVVDAGASHDAGGGARRWCGNTPAAGRSRSIT